MPLVPFSNLMVNAERGRYAVGYFESWNLESLLAISDAAEKQRSPVILGFSGIYLPHPERRVQDRLSTYAAMARDVASNLSVPVCLLFNESPNLDWVESALDLGFNLVMFSDDELTEVNRVSMIRRLTDRAHRADAAVEAELTALAGVGGDLNLAEATDRRLTDFSAAREFIEATEIDAFAVNVGQVHLHGRRKVRLEMNRLQELRKLPVPLVLHGATSVEHEDLRTAISLGIRKINVGSLLKQTYFDAMRNACDAVEEDFNPYEVIGSGLENDVLVAGRVALQQTVEEWMQLFGSAGKADSQ